MHRGPRSTPLCVQYHIQLTPLSFQVSRPSHSWDTAISIVYLENPRLRSSGRSKLGPTPYRFKSRFLHVNPLSHSCDTDFFKISPWKSKVKVIAEAHIVGITPYRLISHSMLMSPRIPIYSYLKFDLEIQGQGHGWGECWSSQHASKILSNHIPFVPFQSAIPFLRYDFFKIWPWKSKVKIIQIGQVMVVTHFPNSRVLRKL